MPLADAIQQTMEARGLRTREVAQALGERQDRATFYRLLSGATTEPRLRTLVALCEVLAIAPSDLLALAGVWPQDDHPVDASDLRLRQTFARVHALPADTKPRVARLVIAVAEGWDEADGDSNADGDGEREAP